MQSADIRDRLVETLEPCHETVAELEANCCVPGRSPQMQVLADLVEAIQRRSAEFDPNDGTGARQLRMEIENTGAHVGRLQVSCCAPSRAPLYEDLIHRLTRAQRLITSTAGLDH